ncbi:MAG: serine hydrolase, partial [Bacteroidota bacterium]
ANPTKREVTIEHLLSMTAGFVWNESLTPIDEDRNNLGQLLESDEYVAYVLNQPLEAPPGRRFSYNSGCNIILLNIMDKLLDESLEEYFELRIFSPLGIEDYQVSNTPTGLPNYSTGLIMNQLDLTKIGYLMLKNGEWDGLQIIDSRWMDQILESQSTISNQNDFGYNWWLFNNESFIFTNYSVDDVNYLYGARNQGIYFSQKNDLLVVINNGIDPGRSFSNSSFWAFTRVLDSLLPVQF